MCVYHICMFMCVCTYACVLNVYVCVSLCLCVCMCVAHVYVSLCVVFTVRPLFCEVIPATPFQKVFISFNSSSAPPELHPSLSPGTQCPASHLCM